MKECDMIELINRRARQILVHSYLYYVVGSNIIEDYKFDAICNWYIKTRDKYPKVMPKTVYHEELSGLTHASGFDLKYPQEIINKAIYLRQMMANKGE